MTVEQAMQAELVIANASNILFGQTTKVKDKSEMTISDIEQQRKNETQLIQKQIATLQQNLQGIQLLEQQEAEMRQQAMDKL